MKMLAKKSLAILLAMILAATGMISALAYTTSTDDIIYYYAQVDEISSELFWFNVDVDARYTIFSEATFAFTLIDSLGNVVADQTMGEASVITPDENEGYGMELYFDFTTLPVLDRYETYSLIIAAGAFKTAMDEPSGELIVDFSPDEFIPPPPTFLQRVYFFLSSNIFTRILFAPLLAILDLFIWGPIFF